MQLNSLLTYFTNVVSGMPASTAPQTAAALLLTETCPATADVQTPADGQWNDPRALRALWVVDLLCPN